MCSDLAIFQQFYIPKGILMHKLVRTIDSILNKFTMYRVIVYGLSTLLFIALTLSLTGAVSISVVGLVVSVAALVASCYAANLVLSSWLHAAANTESWLITALILACILPPVHSIERLGLVMLAGVVAIASKYLIVRRGTHVFNPAAFGAFAMSITGLLPVTWWIATPALAPFTVLLALVVLRKIRKFTLFASFAVMALFMLLYIGAILQDQTISELFKQAVLSWPILFLGSIMLTEPATLPATRYHQVLFAILTGALFASQLHIGGAGSTPQLALLIGNAFVCLCVPLFGAIIKLKQLRRLSGNAYEAIFERPAYLTFAAGQYMEWTLPHKHSDSRGNRRTFSIASSPTESDICIGFKHYQPSSSFKTSLLAMKPGAYIRVAHVAGDFTLPADISHPVLCIAGGIGITPFRSMLQYLIDTGQKANIVLFYVAKSREDFTYTDILQRAESIGLTVHYCAGQQTADIAKHVPDLPTRTAYVSGPDAFVSHYTSMLRDLHVKTSNIKTDHFTGY